MWNPERLNDVADERNENDVQNLDMSHVKIFWYFIYIKTTSIKIT